MNFITQMFSEQGGSASSMRGLAFMIVAGFILVWVKVSWTTNVLAPVSIEQTGIVLGALGIKAWQRGKENGKGNGDTTVFTKP